MDRQDLICVGYVLGAHGIRGWVRVFSNTSPRGNILKYGPWLIEQGDELRPVGFEGRVQGKHVLARLEDVADRDRAEELTGCRLYIERSQLPPLQHGDYYWSDLIGLEVRTLEDGMLGVVDTMMETGANDVMVVKGERERLIPFVLDDIVREVDLQRRRIVVDWSLDD